MSLILYLIKDFFYYYLIIHSLFQMEASDNQHRLQYGMSSDSIRHFMTLALQQAKTAFNNEEVPVGCVFVKEIDGKYQVIEASYNLTNQYKNASSHCEINCLKQMQSRMTKQQISKCILFVTVEPCIMCAHALNCMGIRFVYFGQFNDRFGGCGSVLRCNEFDYIGGIMEKQSWSIIKGFYQRGNQRIPEQQRNKKRKKRQTS